MQNVSVYRDPLAPEDPTAFSVSPADCSIWRNDNEITWRLLDPAYEWVTIVFDAEWVMDGGTQPEQVDARTFKASGPPPNMTTRPVAYRYTMAIRRTDTGETIRIGRRSTGGVAIDPDVWNQPQP